MGKVWMPGRYFGTMAVMRRSYHRNLRKQPVGLRQNLHPNLALARDLAQFLPYLPQKEQEQDYD